MCRMVGYLGGSPVSLSSAVLEPEHSLHVQSYAPTEMATGVVNADASGGTRRATRRKAHRCACSSDAGTCPGDYVYVPSSRLCFNGIT